MLALVIITNSDSGVVSQRGWYTSDVAQYRFPPLFFYILMIAWIIAIIAIAYMWGVQLAGLVLASSLVFLAAARIAAPAGFTPQIRSKAIDAITLLVFAAIIAYLSQWGDTPMPR